MPDSSEMPKNLVAGSSPEGSPGELREGYPGGAIAGQPLAEDIDAPSPIKAEDTLLATDPEIVEALEAIAERSGAQTELPEDHKPLDVDLALSGLKTLRKSQQVKTDAPNLKREAVETKNQLLRIRAEETTTQDSPSSSAESDSETTAAEAKRRDVDARLSDDLQAIGLEAVPFGEITGVLNQISVSKRGDEFVITDSRAYEEGLQRLVRKSLKDPNYHLSMYGTLALLGGIMFESLGPDSAQTRVFTKLVDDFKALGASAQFEPHEIERHSKRWLGFIGDELPGDDDISRSSTDEELLSVPSDADEEHRESTRRTLILEAATVWASATSGSIKAGADTNPYQAFDHLYSVAHLGFDPQHQAKFKITNAVVRDVLESSADLRAILALGFGLNGQRTHIAQRSRDLKEVLRICGGANFEDMIGALEEGRGAGAVIVHTKFAQELLDTVVADRPTGKQLERQQRDFSKMAEDGRLIFPRILQHGNPLAGN